MRSLSNASSTVGSSVSVATQTDGDVCHLVDSFRFEQTAPSGSSISLMLSNLELNSDESYIPQSEFSIDRRVMSSQTDLTLSDFDIGGVGYGSDDFESESDEGLDDSFNPYEVLISPTSPNFLYHQLDQAPRNDMPMSPTSRADEGNSPRKRVTQLEPDAEGQCQKFFDLLRSQCNAAQTYRKPVTASELEAQRRRTEANTVRRGCCEEVNRICLLPAVQNGPRPMTTRLVPKMGTKIDFVRQMTSSSNRHSNSSPRQQLQQQQPKTKTIQPVSSSVTELQSPFTPPPPLPPPQQLSSCCRGERILALPVSFYHSDSDKSSSSCIGGPTSTSSREWNSDGDVKNLSFPSSDDSAEPSPEEELISGMTENSDDRKESLRMLYKQYADVMYTNEANLQHTMMVQQRLFEQQLANRNKPLSIDGKSQNAQIISSFDQLETTWAPCTGAPTLEWVIKRRADGTRYITRRPVPVAAAAARVTKDRTKQVDERRCVATITDDDRAQKAGRCWTREERRQQMEKIRSQKQHTKEIPKTAIPISKDVAPRDLQPFVAGAKRTRTKKDHKPRVTQESTSETFHELLLAQGKTEAQGKPDNPLLSVITI